MARAMTSVCANGLGESTRDEFISATRTRHRDVEVVLPVKGAPGVTATEKYLELLIGRGWVQLREVYEAVEGKLDHVTKFVGASHDNVKGFAGLRERRDGHLGGMENKKDDIQPRI